MTDQDYSKHSKYKQNAFSLDMDSPIRGFIKVNNKLYIICDDNVSIVETGIEKDPENKYPFAPNTSQKVLNKGVKNQVVKEIYDLFESIENKEIGQYQCITFKKTFDVEKVKSVLWEILINLSSFEDSYNELINTYNCQLATINNQTFNGNNFEVKAFIPNIDKKVKDLIVLEIGGLLNKLTNLLIISYNENLSKNKKDKILQNDKRLFFAIDSLSNNGLIDKNSGIYRYIKEQNKDFLSELVDIRNALEHKQENKFVKIRNFGIDADRYLTLPMWEINIKGSHYTKDLIKDIVMYSKKIFELIICLIRLLLVEQIGSYYIIENGSIYYMPPKINSD